MRIALNTIQKKFFAFISVQSVLRLLILEIANDQITLLKLFSHRAMTFASS